jgi:hypothetical protein
MIREARIFYCPNQVASSRFDLLLRFLIKEIFFKGRRREGQSCAVL